MKRLLSWLALGAIGLTLLAAATLWFVDTDIGHRLIVDKIAAQTPKSGLRVKIGRIDGSIYGKAQLRAVRLYDNDGLFFEAPAVDLDWSPLRWVNNQLYIDRLHSKFSTLHKLPKLKAGDKNRPILPGFDIHIGSLSVDTLRIEPKVTGVRRSGMLTGSADIIAGRAQVRLNANTNAGDQLALRLDAEPDRDRFNLDAGVKAPARGVFGAVVGTPRPFDLIIRGNGAWRAWNGTLSASVSGAPIADLALTANAGQFGVNGQIGRAHV